MRGRKMKEVFRNIGIGWWVLSGLFAIRSGPDWVIATTFLLGAGFCLFSALFKD